MTDAKENTTGSGADRPAGSDERGDEQGGRTGARSDKRRRLIDTALSLFYRDGIHATGIERIIAEAGVARMTLYKHFPSKEDLVVAALEQRDRSFRAWLAGRLAGRPPRAQLLELFEALADWFQGGGPGRDGFWGCAFINAAAEYGDAGHPVHQAARAHKQALLEMIGTIAEAAGAADPKTLARRLLLVQDGAIVTAQLAGPNHAGEAVTTAKAIARRLIADALAQAQAPNDLTDDDTGDGQAIW